MTARAYYNEIDPFAATWLRRLITAGHIAPGDVDERDIKDVRPADLHGYTQCHWFAGIGVWSHALRLSGWPDDRPVWTGSCPCQPFSVAGEGKGFDDQRHLWPYWHHLIRVCRPPVIFGEQVASKDALQWFDLVQTDLEGEGYAIGAADLCAAGVGAPHIRQRLWFVADADDAERRANATSRHNSDGSHARWPEGPGDAQGCGGAGELADTEGARKFRELRNTERQSRSVLWSEQKRFELDSGGKPYKLGNASQHGHEEREWKDREPDGRSGAQGGLDIVGASSNGPLDGFWRDSEWLYCRDGKHRPVESGTFPLAHGSPARMGRLRGYGNALVAQVAVEFIQSYLDVVTTQHNPTEHGENNKHMGRTNNEMEDEIADLERMARRPPSGGDGGMDLNSPFMVDGKEGVNVGAQFVPGKYALEVIDLSLKMSKGGFDERTQTTKESIPYLELTFQCIAGEDPSMVGEQITDRLMAKGKGVTRFKIFAKSVGMWNDDTDQFVGAPIDFMGVRVWATIKDEKSVYQGQERIRSIVDFAGYEPIDKYPLPDDSYEFDDDVEETPAPAPRKAPVAAAPVEDEVDDLEAGEPEPEDLDEVEPEEAPAPAPASRPRARAAGQAGQQPPWK